MLLNETSFKIYFGNQQDQLYQDQYYALAGNALFEYKAFASLHSLMPIDQLIFLRQIHAASGLLVTKENATLRSFSYEGDFLITKERNIGLGVMTADCLPIVFYDSCNKAIGIAHAGWKGTVNHIVIHTLRAMQKNFETKLEDLQIYFGPSAQACCYEVTSEFLSYFESFSFAEQVIIKRGEKFFFDLVACNRLQLEAQGIKQDQMRIDYALCTIEDGSFFSHRRQPSCLGRQMTVICLS